MVAARMHPRPTGATIVYAGGLMVLNAVVVRGPRFAGVTGMRGVTRRYAPTANRSKASFSSSSRTAGMVSSSRTSAAKA
jgi:hypothetical protein